MSESDNPIPFFFEFQKVAELLSAIRTNVDLNTDVVWTRFESPQNLIDELSYDIEKLQFGDYKTLSKAHLEFAPTGTYQELSISNGWGDEYLKLAEQFDYYDEKIKRG